jgi:RNA polymerase sigma-70 factor (ECF subfamily)
MEAAATQTLTLLRRWHAGERAALDALIERHLDWVRDYVRRRLGPELRGRAETQDVVHDGLVRVLQYMPRFELADEDQFRALVARIVENTIRDQNRRMHRGLRDVDREHERGDSVLRLDPPAAEITRPSQHVSRDEHRAWVRLAIEFLGAEDRDVILLREADGLEFAAIAERLGVTEDAARKRFQRALPRLAAKLQELRDGRLAAALAPGPS